VGLQDTSVSKEDAAKLIIRGWLQILGPTTASNLGALLALDAGLLFQALLAMEMQGLAMRGVFERGQPASDEDIEWCERRILQRIHRLTLQTLRKQVEAVPPAAYMHWLLTWQHLAPGTQLAGEEGVLSALEQLEGFEAPAIEWERTLLPQRIAQYDPRWLDNLCLSGAIGWGRFSPHPAWSVGEGTAPRRVVPSNAAPIAFYRRDSAAWLPVALEQQSIDEATLAQALSANALRVRALLQQRGACFTADLQRITGFDARETQHALWELATAGLAAADGFDQLRAVMDPKRKRGLAPEVPGRRALRATAGRWALMENDSLVTIDTPLVPKESATERARRLDAALESHAWVLLRRYGILFRDLLERETTAPKWRDLLGILRRLEARGEIRGGRFVSGFGGEQYAIPQAADSLRAHRRRQDAADKPSEATIKVAAADPCNLAGIVVSGTRIAAIPGKAVEFRDGVVINDPALAVTTTHDAVPADAPPQQEPSAPPRRLFQ
jgi:ATP-dependent Lhr-like helicase